MKTKNIEIVELDVDDIDRITDIIQDELDAGVLDIEQRESLQKVVTLSIGSYLMLLREKNCRTTKLTQ
jgi:aspartate/glutamate racemase